MEGVSEIEFEGRVTALVMAEMYAVAPAVGEKIGCSDVENDALVPPGVMLGNFDGAPVPTYFITLS